MKTEIADLLHRLNTHRGRMEDNRTHQQKRQNQRPSKAQRERRARREAASMASSDSPDQAAVVQEVNSQVEPGPSRRKQRQDNRPGRLMRAAERGTLTDEDEAKLKTLIEQSDAGPSNVSQKVKVAEEDDGGSVAATPATPTSFTSPDPEDAATPTHGQDGGEELADNQFKVKSQKEMDDQLLEYHNDLAVLRETLDKQTKELAKKDNEIKQLKNDVQALENDVNDDERGYAKQIEDLELDARTTKALLSQTQASLHQTQRRLDTSDDLKDRYTLRAAETLKQKAAIEAKVSALEAQNTELQREISGLREEANELHDVRESLGQYEEHEQDIGQALDGILQGMLDNENTIVKIEHLGKTIQEAQVAVEKSEAARKVAEQEIEKAKSSQEDKLLQIEQLNKTLQEAQLAVEKSEAARKAAEEEIEHANSLQEDDRIKFESLEKNLQEAQEAVKKSESARKVAELQIEETKMAHSAIDFSDIHSTTFSPVEVQKKSLVLAMSSIYNVLDKPSEPVAMVSAGVQTAASKPRMVDTGIQTAKAQMSISKTQTTAIKTRNAKTQTTNRTTQTYIATPAKPDLNDGLQSLLKMLMWLLIAVLIIYPHVEPLTRFKKPAHAYVYEDEWTSTTFPQNALRIRFEQWLGVDTRPMCG